MNPEFRRAAIVGIFAFFVTLWLAINYQFQTGMIYTSMVVICIISYLASKNLGLNNVLIGIDRNWGNDISIGFVLGLGFIMLNMLAPSIIIGVPVLPMSQTDQYIVAGLVAPVAEEFGFRGLLLGLLDKYTPFAMATIVSSAVFSFYHWMTYGQAMSGAFIGAFLFGVVACITTKKTRSLIPVIIMHMMFNTYLLAKLVVYGI